MGIQISLEISDFLKELRNTHLLDYHARVYRSSRSLQLRILKYRTVVARLDHQLTGGYFPCISQSGKILNP